MTPWRRLIHFIQRERNNKYSFPKEGSAERAEPLSLEDFSKLSLALNRLCDTCDTELKDAISYNLRILEGQTTTNKFLHGPNWTAENAFEIENEKAKPKFQKKTKTR